jgi:ParB-like chromosome segregation protein Spo0J
MAKSRIKHRQSKIDAPAARVWHGNDDLRPLLVPIETLKLDPRNARVHGEANQAAIRKSLQKFGQQKPIVIDSNGFVRAGNGTFEQAKALGWSHVAVTRSNLSDDALKAYALADNTSGDLAAWDPDELRLQLEELTDADFDLDAAGLAFSDKELDDLIGEADSAAAGKAGPPPAFAPAASETQSRLDQRKPIVCPHCGKEFVPGATEPDHA